MKYKIAILVVLAAFFVSCSPVRVRMFPGADRYPQTSPESVDLLRREPPRPHVAFAEIVYDPPNRASRQEVDWVLRERAARIGADALVIEVDNVFRGNVWSGIYRGRSQRVYRDHDIVGIAIRYRR
jgi:hypothetical protein